jgi:hypothetical protein
MKKLVLAATLALLGSSANAAVFTDTFDSPVISGYEYGGTDTAGAQFGDQTGLQANGSDFQYAAATTGNQTAHIQSTGSFTESLTNLIAGQQYLLTFDYAQRAGYGVDGLMVSADGTSIFNGIPGSAAFSSESAFFTAATDAVTLTFAGTVFSAPPFPAGDFNVGVDSISVSAVPEPATWAMMVLGFMAVGFMAYRRRSNPSFRIA